MDVSKPRVFHKQRIDFVTGKGGVGKSTVAAALAWRHVRAGEKVLLVELGETSFYSKYLKIADPTTPQVLREGLSVVRWEGEACLKEYIQYYVRFGQLVDLFFDNQVMRALIQGAPALRELALLGKITSAVRGIGLPLPFDRIVVDAFATGHFLALFRAPKGLYEAVKLGPMGEQTKNILATLNNPEISQVYIVTLPEELPVAESKELSRDLQKDFSIQPRWIANRLWPEDLPITGLPDNAFTRTWVGQRQLQARVLAEVTREDAKFLRLPFVLNSDPWALLGTLAEAAQ